MKVRSASNLAGETGNSLQIGDEFRTGACPPLTRVGGGLAGLSEMASRRPPIRAARRVRGTHSMYRVRADKEAGPGGQFHKECIR
jgi:hypothetical protein